MTPRVRKPVYPSDLLDAIVVRANTDERACALCLLVKVKKAAWSRNLRTIFADSGFGGKDFEQQIQEQLGYTLEIISLMPSKWGLCCYPRGGSSSRSLAVRAAIAV